MGTTVVRRQGDVLREAARIAESGGGDITLAHRAITSAIAEAEADGFRVGDDLSVTDPRGSLGSAAMSARWTAARLHSENIHWHAGQLVRTDALVGKRLHAQAAELEAIRFDGEGNDGPVQAVEFRQSPAPTALPDARRRAIEYADRWARGANPEYKDFGGGYDCANFVSQALQAGGFENDGSALGNMTGESSDEWYYDNHWRALPRILLERKPQSATWSLAREHHNYFTQHSGLGEITSVVATPSRAGLDPLAASHAGLVPGDLIYYKNAEGEIDHVAMYVGTQMAWNPELGREVPTDVVDQHANGSNNVRNDWMPDTVDYHGGLAQAEFVHLTYPGE